MFTRIILFAVLSIDVAGQGGKLECKWGRLYVAIQVIAKVAIPEWKQCDGEKQMDCRYPLKVELRASFSGLWDGERD